MTVEYHDYYAALGVARDASARAIHAAYRKLARKHHPDVDKSPGATERFQRISEAREVLEDPKKRALYDRLGARWQEGDAFTPPPDVAGQEFRRDSQPFAFGEFGDAEQVSSFFEALFGRASMGEFEASESPSESAREADATIRVALEEVLHGATRRITLSDGRRQPKTIDVQVPRGIADGGRIRLAGQGRGGRDLLLRVEFAPHERFRAVGHDLLIRHAVNAWDAALGTKVEVVGLDARRLEVSIPCGSSSGRTLRLRGQGLFRRDGTRGDLLIELALLVPARPTAEQARLWRELSHTRAEPSPKTG